MIQKYEDFLPCRCKTFQTSKQSPLDNYLTNHKRYVKMDQCHQDTITVLTNPNTIPEIAAQTDAIITTIPDLLLLVKTADCLPILLYHPLPLIGAIHAGRKGTELEILKKTLILLKEKFNIQNNLSVWFGPHIHEENYEIDSETKTHFNLRIKNKTQLLKIFPEEKNHFYELNKCTFKNNDEFFSFRKEATALRNFSGIKIL